MRGRARAAPRVPPPSRHPLPSRQDVEPHQVHDAVSGEMDAGREGPDFARAAPSLTRQPASRTAVLHAILFCRQLGVVHPVTRFAAAFDVAYV